MKKQYIYGLGSGMAAFLCAAFFAHAAVPAVINYQSRLRTAAGAPITSATRVSFSLYSAATGGTALWTETYSAASGACRKVSPDANGYFSVQMGSCEAFPATLTFTTPLYLGVTIESDAEASPRVTFAPAPYAMNAIRVGDFVSDTSANTLTGEPTGTATAGTQGVNSSALILQGSGWNGSAAQNKGFKLRTTVTDSSAYRLGVFDTTSGSEAVSVLNNGRVGIGIATPQSELEVAGVIYANDFRTRGGSISTTGDGTNDLIRFTRPKLLIGHTADLNVAGPITNLMQLTPSDVTFLEPASFSKLVSIPARQIKFGLNTFTFPVAAPASDGLVLTTETDGTLSWTSKTTGSVTSIGLSAPSDFTVSGSPVTSSGSLSFDWKAQAPNEVLAGPVSGFANAAPAFRALAALDIPDLTAAKITSGVFGIGLIPDIPSTKVTGVLDVANIPDLNASKITTGTFDAARLPAFTASQIPDLSADKITSGTLNIDRIPDIPTTKVTGVVPATQIADLDAAKITTGAFDEARIPTLDITTKTSGTLGVSRGGTGITSTAAGDIIFSNAINSLATLGIGSTGQILTVNSAGLPVWQVPATNGTVTSVGATVPSFLTVAGSPITDSGTLAIDLADQSAGEIFAGPLSGTGKPAFRALAALDIPDLDAAKIISGVFGIGRIPDIDAAKVTTGIFDAARIPTLGASQIPDLDASKITTGTFDAARLPALTASQIPDLSADKITSGTLGVSRGGTGITSTAAGDIIFSNAINSLATLGIGSTGQILTVNSAGLPVWQNAPSTGVTSVGISLPSIFSVSGSPITSSGTIDASLASQGVNTFFAGPASGGSATPSFRAIDAQDIPGLSADKITSGVFSAARIPALASSSVPDLDASKITSGIFDIARIPAIPAANISGVLASSSIPSLDASKIGSGVLGVANGGTGLSSVGANGTVLTSVAGTPTWSPVPAGLGGSGVFGQMAFWTASSTLAGNSKILVDNTNSRLAIGTSTMPATTLVVGGDTTFGGDVVPSEGSSFDLGSPTKRIRKAYIDDLYIYGGPGGTGTSTISSTITVFNGVSYTWPSGGLGNNFVLTTDTNGNLGWQNPTNLVPEGGWRSLSGNVRLGVPTDKVGIGTATPATKLDVVGDIQASGFLSSGAGQIKFGAATYNFPTTLPSAGQVLTASSTPGNLTWKTLNTLPSNGTTNQVLLVDQSGTPVWGSIGLGNSPGITGILPYQNGGTGLSGYMAGDLLYGDDMGSGLPNNRLMRLPIGSAGQVLTVIGGRPTWQAPASSLPASAASSTVLAGPIGSAGAPTFRQLSAVDIPALDANKITSGTLPVARGGTGLSSIGANGTVLTASGGLMVWQAPSSALNTSAVSMGRLPYLSATGVLSNSGFIKNATSTEINEDVAIKSALGDGSYIRFTPAGEIYQNSPTNPNRLLVDTQGSGTFRNITAQGALSVVATTTVKNVVPAMDNVYDLGSPTARWRDIYVGPATIKVVGSGGQIIESIGEGAGANAGKLVVKSTAGERLIGGGGESATFAGNKIITGTLSAATTTIAGDLNINGGGLVMNGNTLIGKDLTANLQRLNVWAGAFINSSLNTRDVTPLADNLYPLGSATKRFSELYAVNANINNLKLPGNGAGSGRVLMSDANGNATWQDLPAPAPAATSGFGDFTAVTIGGSVSSYLSVAGNTTLRDTTIGIAGGSSRLTLNGSIAGARVSGGGRTVVGSDASGAVKWVDPLAGINNIHIGDTDIDATMGLTSRMLSIATITGTQTRNAAYHNIYSDVANTLSFAIAANPKMVLKTTGLEVLGSVKANGVTLTSDRRLKGDITKLSPVLAKLDMISGVNFTWNDDKTKKKQLGVIAQDVERAFPELVDTDSITGMKSVNYSGLAAVAIQGVKELDVKVRAAAPTLGEGVIQKGESEITIFTTRAASSAKIFVTPVGSTGGQVLYVGEIRAGESFSVKADKPLSVSARFNWMIVGK